MAIELYKHNKDAYENILKHLEKSNKTCIIHPTGTGKSFISLKFLYDNRDKKCLFMCPTEAIIGQINTHIENEGLSLKDFSNLKFCCYTSSDKVKNNNYDCIVLDEFHRIGADVWGKNVNELIDNNKNAKILGISATPIRYLDDNRDMSKEIFNGDIASQMTLAEAIVKKILPVPNYISSVYSFQEDIDKIQKQINNYKNKIEAEKHQTNLDKAKNILENSKGLEEVFSNNIQNKNGKFIVFCRDYEHMKQMEEKCKEWFKNVSQNIEISEVYSKQGKELNKYFIDYFENNKNSSLKLLFSIEMLNEGLHVNDIDGVVMFRPTESPIIYFQQLGRALSVGHNDNPLIFDIVNNYNSIDSIVNLKDEVEELIDTIIEGRKNGEKYPDYPKNEELKEIVSKFKIIEENKNIIEILNDLKVETEFTWDDWYKLAEEYYNENKNLYVPTNYITKGGARLGEWIRYQRKAYNKLVTTTLTPRQIELLEKIGMSWSYYNETWMNHYQLAKIYFDTYGNLEIPNRFKTSNGYEYNENGVALGVWIKNQRMRKNSLSDEQIKLLDDIGMQWESVNDLKWMKYYKLAKNNFDYFGELRVPDNFRTTDGINYDENGVNLDNWLHAQVKAYKGQSNIKMTPDKIKLLEDIGNKWFVKKNTDKNLQQEEINEKNSQRKIKEINNRFFSLLNKYDDNSLPSKDEINNEFLKQLNEGISKKINN